MGIFKKRTIESAPALETPEQKAEKFLEEEKKKEEFTKKRFEELEQEYERLKKMPSTTEFYLGFLKNKKTKHGTYRIAEEDVSMVNEGIRRDEDLSVARTMLKLRECQEMFNEYKTLGSSKTRIYFEGRPYRLKGKDEGFDVPFYGDDEECERIRKRVINELGTDIGHEDEIKILEELKENEEKVFGTDFFGMELVFAHKAEIYRPIGSDKDIKDAYKEISVRYYDPEERAKKIQETEK